MKGILDKRTHPHSVLEFGGGVKCPVIKKHVMRLSLNNKVPPPTGSKDYNFENCQKSV